MGGAFGRLPETGNYWYWFGVAGLPFVAFLLTCPFERGYTPSRPEREIQNSEESLMKPTILKTAGMALLFVGVGGLLVAAVGAAPEIDAASAGNAIALLGGAVLLIRSRKR